MKLSAKELAVASAIFEMKRLEFTLDELCEKATSEKGPNYRKALAVTLRSLQRKLLSGSIRLHRITKLGRGYKALYTVDKSFFNKMRAIL